MNKRFSEWAIKRVLFAALAGVLLTATPARAGDSVPDWFRQLAHQTLPKYSDEADAVVLLDEETLTIRDNGDIYDNVRRVVKILRPSGKHFGTVGAYFDKDTKLESIRAWSISPTGQEYQLKEKDAIERSPWDYEIFSDTRVKMITLPALDVGTFVAFEYQQRRRPYAYGDSFWFQQSVPVRVARYNVNLPAGWEYQYHFANWTELKPTNTGGNTWTWEVHDVPGIEHEPSMPAAASIEGRMVISFYSPTVPQATRMATWNDVGNWANMLNASRRVATPKMQAKVAELTQNKDAIEKMRAIASYVQHGIRYVAIEIGIGGFQAHMAGDIFANGYGDCKDKATLLATMLREAGIESYLVLVHDERGVVNPSNPTPWTFNHMIVAIKVPKAVDDAALFASVDDPKLGKLLFFDPTNDRVPFGWIPGYEQESYGLVVSGDGGQLVKMPVLAPALNRMLRVAHLQLTSDGSLSGEVEEIRSGEEASSLRAHLGNADRDKRQKYFEGFLSEFLDQSKLTYAGIEGLDAYDQPLILRYKFIAANYAKSAGDLLLVRPRVLGQKANSIAEEKKERKFPVSFESTWLQSDLIDIKLPAGYKVDELPDPIEVKTPFAEYKSKTEVKDDVLYYNRSYERKNLTVPLEDFSKLRTFMRGIAADERNTAVLKKAQP